MFLHKSEVLAQHCRELGTDFDSITRSSNYNVIVAETEAEVAEKLAQLADFYRLYAPEEQVQNAIEAYRNNPAVGTPEQVAEALSKLKDAGMTYAICYFHDAAHDLGSVELFEREVIPALA